MLINPYKQNKNDPVSKYTLDRKNPYEFNSELFIRKELEKVTGKQIQITRNEDLYEYDLEVFGWFEDQKKRLLGFVEVECSSPDTWNNYYPKFWKEYSYLKRKVFTFENGSFTTNLRENFDKTVYLKLNNPQNDAHCNSIKEISLMMDSKRSNGTRKGSYLGVPVSGNDSKVHRGLTNSLNYIVRFMETRYNKIQSQIK